MHQRQHEIGLIMTTRSRNTYWALITSWMLGACGTAAATGTQPHEKSVAQHRDASAQEAAEDRRHAAAYDPQASSSQERCDPGIGQPPGYPVSKNAATPGVYPTYPVARICWSEKVNPTAMHQKLAEEHRQVAAQHRTASETLRAVEARACAGLADEDRDTSPFSQRTDIQSVSPLRQDVVSTTYESRPEGGSSPGRLLGAIIVFRAVPGLTAQWLQRIVDCHLARNAAIGHETASAEMAYCPLAERGARAVVRESRGGFAVDVRADDPPIAEEIWRRAQRLVPGAQ